MSHTERYAVIVIVQGHVEKIMGRKYTLSEALDLLHGYSEEGLPAIVPQRDAEEITG